MAIDIITFLMLVSIVCNTIMLVSIVWNTIMTFIISTNKNNETRRIRKDLRYLRGEILILKNRTDEINILRSNIHKKIKNDNGSM